MASTRPPVAGDEPDLMNDDQYATNLPPDDGSPAEPDTCRICRGEATATEALFYPCKCSGSIKFVHQDCLMEWLSHSQKKHCELCKTPFRFTKLYAPDMPQQLPTLVVARHLVLHAVRNLATWLRFCLVVVVWLGWLPWTMRQVWGFLFWFGDGGWNPARVFAPSDPDSITAQALKAAQDALELLSGNGTSPVTPLLSNPTSSAAVGSLFELPSFLLPFLHGNLTDGYPLAAGFVKAIMYGMGMPFGDDDKSFNQTLETPPSRYPTLLSDVQFLKTLTRHTGLNKIIISTIEGQVITVLVVVCFILIFLIREWVVQQQPGLNMGVGFNPDFAGDQPRERLDFEPPREEPEPVPIAAAPRAPEAPRRRMVRFDPDPELPTERPIDRIEDEAAVNALRRVWAERAQNEFTEATQQATRPLLQSRDAMSSAVEIQRQLTDDRPDFEVEASDAALFVSIWRRAEGRQDEVMRIIEAEGLTDRMESYVSAMSKQVSRSSLDARGWQRVFLDDFEDRHSTQDGESSKGKEKAPDADQPEADRSSPTPSWTSGGRPRAVSDGPPLREKSPLANDSWSFPTNDASAAAPTNPWKFDFDVAMEAPSSPRPSQSEFPMSSLLDFPDTPTSDAAGMAADSYPSPPHSPQPAEDSFETGHRWDDEQAHTADELAELTQALEQVDALAEDHAPVPAAPQDLFGRIADFLWGDVAAPRVEDDGANDEHIVQDLAAEAPFVPVNGPAHGLGPDDAVDREVAAAAVAAGIDPNDPDAVDDAEDFDGIMELIGMRGPLTGLVQNGMFSAVLISLTVACGVWIPYNIGRLVLLLSANPIPTIKLPLKLMFSLAAFVQDMSILLLGFTTWLCLAVVSVLTAQQPVADVAPEIIEAAVNATLSGKAWGMTVSAGDRILLSVFSFFETIAESEIPAFSAVSHEALVSIKASIAAGISTFFATLASASSEPIGQTLAGSVTAAGNGVQMVLQTLQQLSTIFSLSKSGPWVVSLDVAPRQVPLDPSLVHWGGTDRFWAILAGYTTLSILGSLYLRKGMPFARAGAGREWETALMDMLHQAGGVMKVILIISIEMLIFPLYCGLLLDLALLPLFENVTIASRVAFTLNSPLTSIFVHWFVGTCYMFHFALFVSMCRKIMRPGVLYFIRDPDDPTFHPVRDVLERNVATQLRKITFSALVYGALVVVCLGGVVWGLSFAFSGVLPIHWSSNEPVLEFPIDLLFYNFLMPLAVRLIKPSDGLHVMYTWCFRKCARILRLTWFLFDERKKDEEGHHVYRSWAGRLQGHRGDIEHPLLEKDEPFQDGQLAAYFCADGQFVRCPASDQVRIPKGNAVFLEVDEHNNRIDGVIDRPDGLHGRDSKQFTKVYVPPHFRYRICLFVLFIWLFAATTGVSMTIIPLVFGRMIFTKIIPDHIAKNDIYAFSIGIYILGSVLYCGLHLRQGLGWVSDRTQLAMRAPMRVVRRIWRTTLYCLRLAYAYAAVGFVIPALYALVIEFYFIIPMHTYFARDERHIIHLVQSWTLGLLYVKLTTRFIMWYDHARPAQALRAITRNGYLNPDVWLATRALILPAMVLLVSALALPIPLAWAISKLGTLSRGASSAAELERVVYRYAYPIFLGLCINLIGVWALVGVLKGWKQRIRDEVYLIGERLHNFGERKSSSSIQAGVARSSRIDT